MTLTFNQFEDTYALSITAPERSVRLELYKAHRASKDSIEPQDVFEADEHSDLMQLTLRSSTIGDTHDATRKSQMLTFANSVIGSLAMASSGVGTANKQALSLDAYYPEGNNLFCLYASLEKKEVSSERAARVALGAMVLVASDLRMFHKQTPLKDYASRMRAEVDFASDHLVLSIPGHSQIRSAEEPDIVPSRLYVRPEKILAGEQPLVYLAGLTALALVK